VQLCPPVCQPAAGTTPNPQQCNRPGHTTCAQSRVDAACCHPWSPGKALTPTIKLAAEAADLSHVDADSSCSRAGQCQSQEPLLACFQRPTPPPPPCTNCKSVMAVFCQAYITSWFAATGRKGFPASDTLLQYKVTIAAALLLMPYAGQWWPCQCRYCQGDRPQAHHPKVHCCRPPWRQDVHMDSHTSVGPVCTCGQQPNEDQGTINFSAKKPFDDVPVAGVVHHQRVFRHSVIDFAHSWQRPFQSTWMPVHAGVGSFQPCACMVLCSHWANVSCCCHMAVSIISWIITHSCCANPTSLPATVVPVALASLPRQQAPSIPSRHRQ